MADEVARALRRRMTPHEVRLWAQLRALRPQGLHFRTQVPIEPHIVDFACLKAHLVIEVDGSQHGMPGQQNRDETRDRSLEASGFKVLRFWNNDLD